MRTPLEIWLKDHRRLIDHADRLVELLAPDDIQIRIADPANGELRSGIAEHLEAFAEITDTHYRDEEVHLLPAIVKHLDRDNPVIRHALGCFAREHDQMYEYSERIRNLLPMLRSEDKIGKSDVGEILRTAYASQTLIRNHSAMEEKEVYPLVGKLPMKVVAEIFEAVNVGSDMNLEHLVKPLYGRDVEDTNEEDAKKKFKYGADGMDFYTSEDGDAEGPEN